LNFVFNIIEITDEYKGHLLLEAARQADSTKLKKYLSADLVGFKHPYTGDTAAHAVCGSLYPKRKQVGFLISIASK